MMAFTKLRRLRQMDADEFRFRLLQRFRISRERLELALDRSSTADNNWRAFWDATRVNDDRLRRAIASGSPGAESLLPEYFSQRRQRFYCLPDRRGGFAEVYCTLFPLAAQRIAAEAEKLCAHRLKIFAYAEIECGPKIPWRKDLVHGIESGLDHWSRIAYLDFAKVGDSKIVWEPSRHQHLVTLALAYRLSGDERYAQECFAQWEDWRQQNPFVRGINWSSSLELAFRVWSWVWVLYLLNGSNALTGKRLGMLTREFALHAGFIAANLSRYFSPNTHLLGEGFALFVVGLLFPELRESQVYLGTGRRILSEEITKQVRPDGSHAEQSTYYHRYATDFFLCAAILADDNGCAFPLAYREQLKRLVEFMVHTAWPDGTHPMVGDADGGRLLPFGARAPNDYRGTLSTAALYFGDPAFRNQAGRLHEETLCLLGPEAQPRFQQLASEPPSKTSTVFPDAGLVVMRGGWNPSGNLLLFDAGPQGFLNSGHGHADALSVICSAQGTNWLVDPGTYVYTGSREWRDYFRSTSGHNTLVVDGLGQAEPLDTFKWDNLCPAQLERASGFPGLDYARGEHTGYKRLPQPVIHRRHVVFVKPDHWFVLDDLAGSGEHSFEFFFHFEPGTRLHIEGNCCRATRNGQQFLILSDEGPLLDQAIGRSDPIQGWYSEDYGQREPAPVLIGKAKSRVPAQIAWGLWAGAPERAALRRCAGAELAWRLESAAGTEYFAFRGRKDCQSGTEISTDAEFAFARQDAREQIDHLTLLTGGCLRLRGAPLFESAQPVEEFNLTRHRETLEVHMQPVSSFTVKAKGIESVLLNSKRAELTSDGENLIVREGH